MKMSFGIVPIRYDERLPHVFIIQNYSLAWLMPKGHAQQGETPQETAARELFEETGLKVISYLPIGPFKEEYTYIRSNTPIRKQVDYFPALVGGTVVLQKEEVKDGRWIPLSSLPQEVSFPELQRIASQVVEALSHTM